MKIFLMTCAVVLCFIIIAELWLIFRNLRELKAIIGIRPIRLRRAQSAPMDPASREEAERFVELLRERFGSKKR